MKFCGIMKNDVTFDGRIFQTLYQYEGIYFLVSSSISGDWVDETMVFRSDKDGNMKDPSDLAMHRPAEFQSLETHEQLVEVAYGRLISRGCSNER